MAGQSGQHTGHDNAIGWLLIFVVFLALCALVWWQFEFEIKNMIRWVRFAEMWVVSLFVSSDYELVSGGSRYPYDQWVEVIPEIPYQALDNETMGIISLLALAPLKWVFAAILFLMSLWALFHGPRTHFRRKLNLDGFIRVQSATFPYIKPFVKFNPLKQPFRAPGSPVPAELPLFAEALGPEEWLAYNQIPTPDGQLDRDALKTAFEKQLGAEWRGPMKLDSHKQVLLAAFCLKAARKREDSDAMLGELAACWSGSSLHIPSKLLRKARSVLRNGNISRTALSKANQHAFETTALLRALATAREEGGVLASAQFVWLRGYDRTLWYPLNNLGRQTYHMEAAGAMSHYKAEKMTSRPIPRPQMDGAVEAICEYMASLNARPIPKLDYGGKAPTGKSKGIKKPKSSGVKKPASASKKIV